MSEKVRLGSRNVAIVGPYLSGKTTLLESLLFVTGAISRKGSVKDSNTVGDSASESHDRHMSVEISTACAEYNDIRFTFIDCPGSVEFTQETYNALMGVDAAIVVCEPIRERVLTLAPLFKFLDDWEIPHLVFVNKMDRANIHVLETLHALKAVSSRPLVAHQYPIMAGEQLTGFIDMVSEQAYQYHPGAPADPIPFPEHLKQEEHTARAEMLEALANFDDHLLEELLEDIEPPQEEILKDLKMELGADLVVPVFFGVAEQDYGVRPLLEALLREAPEPETTAARRLKGKASNTPIAQVLKTYYTPQGGKLSLVRVWQGKLTDGIVLNGVRAGGIYHLMGQQQQSVNEVGAGEIVALSRLEGIKTGDTISTEQSIELPKAQQLEPVYALAITPEKRNDEVKLSSAISKLLEEDPSLAWEQHGDTHEVILWGQGEIHLQVALDRLRRKYNLPMSTHLPQVPYKETIRKPVTSVHGRYKHQSGGHGQFGDVFLDIKPLPRGEGFNFKESIVGGVVPRQYIPGVEMGVREFLVHGPLGFPVVDVAVTLTNGSYHTVDSSEQAFKQAARLAMQTGIPQAQPTLLEPILRVEVTTPSEFTSKVLQLLSGRRGQILGYEGRQDWQGWDNISAYLPQAEMQNFIVELRSLTLGVGYFHWAYDHLQEVPEKLAERVLASNGNGSNGNGK
ncbi:translation elongation factor 2 (EF-2/EF-G) [Trichormus variabilis ATCC 29413]|uniref:Translation elongation factor 2 (EF-2/EF-G) n=2 Tax=Anabaena variabilis TaxID=264691 RepID=Q3M7Y4_TRIV2|nr:MULTISPECIES: elongation factor G [Nostocaceae]ABA22902.1 translation elongation factor 2 (EF-2/EF-G) [Trichormus variabilis ATCC 29413]MBC1215473.1 elongation factor G [Trichormus variabilis ARAD]MBC1257680.1 elongation factor G [Trichormus variabilis V5]MBC1268914.1 elongation factor G [Trichormus variabilis FSR]MBC1303852.1 elongation factor G [Trichormus variabilis N2B]